MSVVRGVAARSVLWERLYGSPARDGVVHQTYRSCTHHTDPGDGRGFLAAAEFDGARPGSWLWDVPEPDVPALTDPAAYDLRRDPAIGDVLTAQNLHAAPSQTAHSSPEHLHAFTGVSADVIMRGGTASGVVYPPALCEIARRFRLRSLGGASAGAIGAAVGAAAELGRMRLDLNGTQAPSLDAVGRQIRQGFAGLADVAGWVAELDPPPSARAEAPGQARYRVAGLFQPARPMRPLFRVAFAAIGGRWRTAMAMVPSAAGPVGTVLAVMALVLSVPALAVTAPVLPSGWDGIGWAAALLATVSLVVVGVVVATARHLWVVGAVLASVGVAIAIALSSVLADWGSSSAEITGVWLATLAAWVVTALIVGIGQVVPLVWRLLHLDRHRYGLIAGADLPPTARWTRWLDSVAGLPADRPVTLWLEGVLDALAGQPAHEVLRFGHLWFGDDYRPPGARSAEQEAALRSALKHPGERRVNLELMTSELTQGRAYRFPGHGPGTSARTRPSGSTRAS